MGLGIGSNNLAAALALGTLGENQLLIIHLKFLGSTGLIALKERKTQKVYFLFAW